ncbi:hypothetical protein ACY2EW_08600 [Serratia nevei]
MDKLSELSKPVAYSLRFRNMHTGEPDKTINANTTFSTLEKAKAYGLGSRYVTQDDGKIVSVRDPSQDPIVEPLYSQEYVSALDGVAQYWIGESAGWKKRAKDAEKRIAELERILDGVTPVMIAGGWTAKGISDYAKSLESKLATPVRLTDERTLWAGEDDYDTGHVKGWNANRLEQAALLKKQGFKFVGDE